MINNESHTKHEKVVTTEYSRFTDKYVKSLYVIPHHLGRSRLSIVVRFVGSSLLTNGAFKAGSGSAEGARQGRPTSTRTSFPRKRESRSDTALMGEEAGTKTRFCISYLPASSHPTSLRSWPRRSWVMHPAERHAEGSRNPGLSPLIASIGGTIVASPGSVSADDAQRYNAHYFPSRVSGHPHTNRY